MTSEPSDLVRGLDPRERAVLVAIYEHKVLLTEHLKTMFFGSLRRAPMTVVARSWGRTDAQAYDSGDRHRGGGDAAARSDRGSASARRRGRDVS